ncbi:hypothetical protein C8Q80DRAFT_201817 [Daedaleopsis nitida]|nr:hypothetical protein C8Q80DRAFT_201817 [Daedaleopsis nitida]
MTRALPLRLAGVTLNLYQFCESQTTSNEVTADDETVVDLLASRNLSSDDRSTVSPIPGPTSHHSAITPIGQGECSPLHIGDRHDQG